MSLATRIIAGAHYRLLPIPTTHALLGISESASFGLRCRANASTPSTIFSCIGRRRNTDRWELISVFLKKLVYSKGMRFSSKICLEKFTFSIFWEFSIFPKIFQKFHFLNVFSINFDFIL